MRDRFKIFALGFIGWVLFFLAARFFFMFYQFDTTTELALIDMLLTFVHGVRMDMAMAGYFSLLPGLILGILFFVPYSNTEEIWSSWDL